MIAFLITFLLQAGIITSTESYDNLSAEEKQEYMDSYQSIIIIEDLGDM